MSFSRCSNGRTSKSLLGFLFDMFRQNRNMDQRGVCICTTGFLLFDMFTQNRNIDHRRAVHASARRHRQADREGAPPMSREPPPAHMTSPPSQPSPPYTHRPPNHRRPIRTTLPTNQHRPNHRRGRPGCRHGRPSCHHLHLHHPLRHIRLHHRRGHLRCRVGCGRYGRGRNLESVCAPASRSRRQPATHRRLRRCPARTCQTAAP